MTVRINNNKQISTATSAHKNWLSSINWQVEFHQNSNKKKRLDSEFEWTWFEHHQKRGLRGITKFIATSLFSALKIKTPQEIISQEWLNTHALLIWEARELLEDELSKLLFDSMLTLRCSNHHKFYFPRINFEDFASIIEEKPFLSTELPLDYLGLPLKVFNLNLHNQTTSLNVISTKTQINLLNSYRQYFIKRSAIDLTPVAGDIVLDCGACIGEISTIIAQLVGVDGEVHLFDPIPLHIRYCQLQASLNPALSHVLKPNMLAVGDISKEIAGSLNDSTSISPGGLNIDAYSMTSLDDYISNKNISRVDVIKMDIEGFEMAALEGASQIIKEFKPRLAISAYHKPEDIWKIPHKLKSQNADYKIYFGHHSPIQWESVYYAG